MFGGEVGVFGGEASPLPPPLDRTLVNVVYAIIPFLATVPVGPIL